VDSLNEQEKSLKKQIKTLEDELLKKIIQTIQNLTDEECIALLEHQWIDPIMNGVNALFETNLRDFANGLEKLTKKYETTLSDIENEIKENGNELSTMIDELEGDEFDIKGLQEFKSLLKD
jgi:type I restriction enzyme M protein